MDFSRGWWGETPIERLVETCKRDPLKGIRISFGGVDKIKVQT